MSRKLSGTDLLHKDSDVKTAGGDVAPPISVASTFKANPDQSLTTQPDLWDPAYHVYSRYTRDTTTRVEHILSAVNHGFAITYASGLAASFAALVHFQPKRIAIRGGYIGFHATIKVYEQARGVKIQLIDIDDHLSAGDLCWLETPLNPTGESRDIRLYANKAHAVGANILVDSTFGPPPLQYPFDFGADCILHSATKYFGGHSDLLSGVLVVKTKEEWLKLHTNRTYLGSMMGSLESWLLLRSLRTLHLRVPRQSENATKLVQWLQSVSTTSVGKTFEGIPGGLVTKVFHSSLQKPGPVRSFNPGQQMTGGWNATFSILLSEPFQARLLPRQLQYFMEATSLGGVESLIEYRLNSDPNEDPLLVRLSIGVEDVEDLKNDLRQGLQKVAAHKAKL